jgi:chaperone required for assembly of F1-ATPase
MSKRDDFHAAEPRGPAARSWRDAGVIRHDEGWAVALDGRPARTPVGAALITPSEALAEAIASEHRAQGRLPDPRTMPLLRLANVALDAVAGAPEAVRADVVSYAESDLLCYRAGEPPSLARAQCDAWDPPLDWAREIFGARFILSEGVVFVAQPPATIAAIAAAVANIPAPFALAALHVMTHLTGSTVLALAVAHGRLSTQEAWRAAHVDEDEQMRVWGEDAEAAQRRAHRWIDMEAAAKMIRLL